MKPLRKSKRIANINKAVTKHDKDKLEECKQISIKKLNKINNDKSELQFDENGNRLGEINGIILC